MAAAKFASLPEELQLHIIEYLDTPSTSSQRLREEPRLSLTDCTDRTLKHVSLASKRLRRLVLPTLFKHARLRLDAPHVADWTNCHVCNDAAMSGVRRTAARGSMLKMTEAYHLDMVTAALERCNTNLRAGQSDDEAQQMGQMAFEEKEHLKPSSALAWIPRFYHALEDFLSFLQAHELQSTVESFVLLTGRMLAEKLHRFPHQAADRDWRFPASAAFWAHLLSTIDPRTVTILAPPTDLACLTNCAIDTFGDWAFSDMDFHILSLQQPIRTPSRNTTYPDLNFATLDAIPTGYPSIASSSLLHLRPWTHLSLNEGSFLKAYGTYEFFERGPPSIVESIKHCILRNLRADFLIGKKQHALSALKSLDYTAIFPFANHADFSLLLNQVQELSLQLAPDPQTGMLDDKARVGKAELADCWTELITTYAELVKPLMTVRQPIGIGTDGELEWHTRSPNIALSKLVSRDFSIPGVKDELDEVFTPLCLPVWAECEQGVFTKMKPVAQDGST